MSRIRTSFLISSDSLCHVCHIVSEPVPADSVSSDSSPVDDVQFSPKLQESGSDGSTQMSPDVETAYQKAMQFVKVTEKLKHAPKSLNVQFEQLEMLREQLSSTIDDLKRQSETT